MSIADLNEPDEFQELMARGRELGVLTEATVATVASELERGDDDAKRFTPLWRAQESNWSRPALATKALTGHKRSTPAAGRQARSS